MKLDVDSVTDLINASATFKVDTWYALQVLVRGDRISGYLDGILIGTTAGGNYRQSKDVTYIGLYTYQSLVWLCNLKVWSVELPV